MSTLPGGSTETTDWLEGLVGQVDVEDLVLGERRDPSEVGSVSLPDVDGSGSVG